LRACGEGLILLARQHGARARDAEIDALKAGLEKLEALLTAQASQQK
jgi:hypothetical protein